ncbi:hypothetical protein LSCM1_04881 [Leishmania martiniquensis]|uniref:Uncharacterized protein n=1 Tax=Leishmania martiniquensis TaxID=1580590 RepID=A0A836KPY8_9TRYP|nr:hypothetical protein LSCM1_04881 [Leishmania martiniquensis]
MLLTTEEVQTITLNAKSVHKYADQAFFPAEINKVGARIGDQPFLSFFVRYHHLHAPERYSWSRVRRVMLLEDVMATQKASTPPLVTSPTIEWRGKTFWVCFAVEAVQPQSSSSLTSNETAEEEIVTLPQLSNTVPTEDEVLAFCVASANRRPTEVYADGVPGEAPDAPPAVRPVEQGSLSRPEGEEGADQPQSPATALDLRSFVPTPRQVELLRQYKKQHLTHHQWTEEEIEESKALRQRYCTMGVATAPVRAVAYMQHQRVEERKQQQQQQQRQKHALATSSSCGAASQALNASQIVEVDLTQARVASMTAESADSQAMTQTQHSTLSAVPPTSPSAAASATDTPLSPFLPRSVLRAQRQQLHPALITPTLGNNVPADGPFSGLLLGGGAAASFSQLPVSQTPPPETQRSASPPPGSLSALPQHLSQLRAVEESFYQYISDESRSANLNRLAEITKRNSETNARNRRRGIANERRLERKGNLLESCGLWITDDKERASKAEDYVKAQAGEASSAKKNDESATAASALTGDTASGDGAGAAKNAEDVFVEWFKAYHDAQRLSFADCADSDPLADGGDADIAPLLQAAADPESDKAHSTSSAGAATDAMRLGRRQGRRLLPNRLRTEDNSPALVQAQLVHRSTVRMAKRAREG